MSEIERMLRWLSDPSAENLSDANRIDAFCKWGAKAADELARLADRVAELEAAVSVPLPEPGHAM